jgi:hypothetical protein
MAYFLLLIMFLRNNQQDTPPNLFFHTPLSTITPSAADEVINQGAAI